MKLSMATNPKNRKHNGFIMSKHKYFVFVLALLVFALSAALWTQEAYAIRISFKRIVFEGKKRSETLTIINNTAETQTYRLGWRRYRMDEKKSLELVKETDPPTDILWADTMIRFAPRRVTIPAGGSQQIRLLLRKPAELQEAEYRAHLWIVTEAKPEAFQKGGAGQSGKNNIRLAVQPAVSLPLFVRNGDLNVTVNISDVSLSKSADNLNVSFAINREGNRSIYGDFEFSCTAGGKDIIIHQVRGVSVYTDINRRLLDYSILLDTPEKKTCDNIKVIYRADPDDVDFKGATLAEGSGQL